MSGAYKTFILSKEKKKLFVKEEKNCIQAKQIAISLQKKVPNVKVNEHNSNMNLLCFKWPIGVL